MSKPTLASAKLYSVSEDGVVLASKISMVLTDASRYVLMRVHLQAGSCSVGCRMYLFGLTYANGTDFSLGDFKEIDLLFIVRGTRSSEDKFVL